MSKARQKNRKPKGRPTQKRDPAWLVSYADMTRDCLRSGGLTGNETVGVKLDDREVQNNNKRKGKQ
jgi:hypothetical protein